MDGRFLGKAYILSKELRIFETGIAKIETVLTYIGVVALIIMMFLGTADVIARYVFNSPIKGALEVSQLLMAISIILGWGYVQAAKANISVTFVINHYPLRARQIVDLLIYIITLALFIIIAWQSFEIALLDIGYGRLIENIYILAYPFKFMVTFGAIMVCLECIIQIIHQITTMMKPQEVN